mmetsp:Transcript_24797/g.71587  ORF Transcript_24797/g.71587 Transcript_24797/m.71587 type:complete len:218 (+) Transcript_24797:705-1358(+)
MVQSERPHKGQEQPAPVGLLQHQDDEHQKHLTPVPDGGLHRPLHPQLTSPLGDIWVAESHQGTPEGCLCLDGAEGEEGDVAAGVPGVLGAGECLGAILNQTQPVFVCDISEWVYRVEAAVDVRHEQGPRPGRYGCFDSLRRHLCRPHIQVNRHRNTTMIPEYPGDVGYTHSAYQHFVAIHIRPPDCYPAILGWPPAPHGGEEEVQPGTRRVTHHTTE